MQHRRACTPPYDIVCNIQGKEDDITPTITGFVHFYVTLFIISGEGYRMILLPISQRLYTPPLILFIIFRKEKMVLLSVSQAVYIPLGYCP